MLWLQKKKKRCLNNIIVKSRCGITSKLYCILYENKDLISFYKLIETHTTWNRSSQENGIGHGTNRNAIVQYNQPDVKQQKTFSPSPVTHPWKTIELRIHTCRTAYAAFPFALSRTIIDFQDRYSAMKIYEYVLLTFLGCNNHNFYKLTFSTCEQWKSICNKTLN